jgi:hypothetical protein
MTTSVTLGVIEAEHDFEFALTYTVAGRLSHAASWVISDASRQS